MEKEIVKPDYGNWVSKSIIKTVIVIFTILLLISITLLIFTDNSNILIVIFKILIVFLTCFFYVLIIYFILARKQFSYEGGMVQDKVLETLMDHIDFNGNGKILDIGCGSGALVNKLAKKYPDAKITGLDYWGVKWNYNMAQCIKNAEIENVIDKVNFVNASALSNTFDNDTFDLIVSNNVFHEIRNTKSKFTAIEESIRVLKKDGLFVFQDLFLLKAYYGTEQNIIDNFKKMGCSEVNFIKTNNLPFIPKMLKLPFMLGALGIVYGIK